ncbi:MAG: YceI family protein [Helicobacteraceae bacterium]|jgi:polyisoprenoid-binding protein YceI|nr:YceI family protein [Helicobacteraceae bacterium]
MKKTALSLLLAFGLAQANCTFSQPSNVDVTWESFKTPMKIGVGGHFSTVNFKTDATKATDLNTLLAGSSVSIDVTSVDSKNKGRDEKLVNEFFKQMSGPTIKAVIVSLKKDTDARKSGTLTASVTMNDVTRDVPMKYSFSNGQLSANGVIDVFDFKADRALKSINTACFALHQGKTWSDVNIGFTMDIKASCPQPVKGHE